MRAGLRWYVGTDPGNNYRAILAHGTEHAPEDPGVYRRSVGDYLDPTRPGRVIDLVNAVTLETGIDAERWRWDRIVSMVAGLEQRGEGGG